MSLRRKILIVDDSAVVRQTMECILSGDPGVESITTAADPIVAMDRMRAQRPDVIVLDIEMPRMDGITFLRKIMDSDPIPVVICSSLAAAGSENALKALEYGAVEIIEKPKLGIKQFIEESKIRIRDVVKAASMAKLKKIRYAPIPQIEEKLTADAVIERPNPRIMIQTTEKVVLVGASTGGTEALRVFLEMMPPDAPGMVIVQHMPEHFTTEFAKRLNGLCRVTVKEAQDNDTVFRGQALIAPGNRHTLLKRSGARYHVEVKDGPLVSRHRPSVDVLFRSAARYAGQNAVGVIMTGMGDDGARGMREMKDAGAYNIAQDENSCVVYGMPQEAVKRGAVDKILSLENIAGMVLRAAGSNGQ
jgi:two-component system chemotaxis response regulator CheB